MRTHVLPWVLLSSCAVVACRKHEDERPPPPAPTSAPPPARTPSVHPGFVGLAAGLAAADLIVEARRGTVVPDEPLIVRHREALQAHFGGAVPGALAFQVVAAGQGRSAVLLQATQGDPLPLIWLLDPFGAVSWSKEHPTFGVKPGISELTLTAGPGGHICLAWCNASTDSVALRRWAEDGAAFSDNEPFHVDSCDALSALYWPKHGWVLAVAGRAGATVQLLSEDGASEWGRDGFALPWTWRSAAAVSFGLDTPDSLLLFRLGQSGGAGSTEYVFVLRLGPDGKSLWPGPLSVKRLPSAVLAPAERLVLESAPDGAIRATLPAAAAGGAAVSVDVQSDGAVVRR